MANGCRVLQERPQAAWSSVPLCKALYVNDFRISRSLGQEYVLGFLWKFGSSSRQNDRGALSSQGPCLKVITVVFFSTVLLTAIGVAV